MNISFYSGKVGRVKFEQCKNGNPYVGFILEDTKNNSISGHINFLYVTCWQTSVIRYLREMNFKNGNFVIIEAMTEYFPEEIKGKTYYRMSIIAKKVYIVKTKNNQ